MTGGGGWHRNKGQIATSCGAGSKSDLIQILFSFVYDIFFADFAETSFYVLLGVDPDPNFFSSGSAALQTEFSGCPIQIRNKAYINTCVLLLKMEHAVQSFSFVQILIF